MDTCARDWNLHALLMVAAPVLSTPVMAADPLRPETLFANNVRCATQPEPNDGGWRARTVTDRRLRPSRGERPIPSAIQGTAGFKADLDTQTLDRSSLPRTKVVPGTAMGRVGG